MRGGGGGGVAQGISSDVVGNMSSFKLSAPNSEIAPAEINHKLLLLLRKRPNYMETGTETYSGKHPVCPILKAQQIQHLAFSTFLLLSRSALQN